MRNGSGHIDIRKHLVHEVMQKGHVTLVRIPTSESSQLADILTQPLHLPQWQACVAGILGKAVSITQGTSVLKRGCYRQAS